MARRDRRRPAEAIAASSRSGGPVGYPDLRTRGGGPTIYFMIACIAGGLAFVLLMIVMRGLLESAIADRTELDEVI